jgi:hypothetical protein
MRVVGLPGHRITYSIAGPRIYSLVTKVVEAIGSAAWRLLELGVSKCW